MKVAAVVLGIGIAILGVRYAVHEWYRNRLIPAVTANATSCLALQGNTTSEQDGRTYIVGSIRNNCDRRFSQVTISFKLDRPPGASESLPQAIVTAYVRDVQPAAAAKFKTAMPVSKNATYRFDGFSAF